ncbi:Male sterility, NAD-binding protein, partial [Metarhizium brunneum ARSEF 3297]
MFSSIAAAAGNRGQSNYSAANMFMVATAMERRRQGFAASVLHLDAVLGVGYIMREFDETVLPTILRGGFMWMEERGFHQCIPEAILAGRPQAGRNPEIITGLRRINADVAEPVPWIRNPRFQHYINWGGDGNLKKMMQNAAVPVRARLFEAALQLQQDDNSEQFNMSNMSADDLGIDSLVAVEIRSWFLREMDVDMPVLKILGGASLVDLITFALENIPSELIPKLAAVETQPMASNESELQKTQLMPLVASSGSNGSVLASIDNLSRSAESTIASSSSESPLPESESEPGDEGLKSRSFEHKSVLPHEVERSVPMSAGQSRFWFLNHFVQDQTTFNIKFSIKINGELNEHKLEAAVKVLGHRHEALRTAFITEGDQNLQCVLKNSLLRLEKRAIRDISQVNREFEYLRDYIYDIQHGETMRMLLLSLSSEQSFLVIGYMHPAIIIPIQDVPLTSNGKLDRAAIEKLQVSNGTERATGAAKLGNVECELREAWEEVISEEVLQHCTIDRGSNFFHVGDATYLEAAETDWTEETALTKHVVDAGPFISAATKSTRGVIIMTGATGFLGLELLKEFVESPSVTKVHCIAVRSQGKLGLFLGSPKVTLHQGDLSAPRAGLSVQAAEAIFGEAGATVHSANVEATKELARLALVHNVPFHYNSTTATGRLNNMDTLYEISLAENIPPPGYSDGYVAGKWASEVFLEKVHERLGLPVCIHRPSSITGPAASDLDVMNSVIKFSRQLKAVPTSSRWRGSLDFISVENAAKGIARVVTGSDQETKLKYLHHSGDVIIPIDQLGQHMQEEDGIEYRELSLWDWTELAVGL